MPWRWQVALGGVIHTKPRTLGGHPPPPAMPMGCLELLGVGGLARGGRAWPGQCLEVLAGRRGLAESTHGRGMPETQIGMAQAGIAREGQFQSALSPIPPQSGWTRGRRKMNETLEALSRRPCLGDAPTEAPRPIVWAIDRHIPLGQAVEFLNFFAIRNLFCGLEFRPKCEKSA
jgi:hypothetical protein